MKRCEEIIELLSLYIDNELDDETAKIVKEHIEMCSSCKAEFKQLQEIVKMCNEVDEVELPDNFKEVLHQKLELEKKSMEDDKKITIMRNRILKTITSVAAIFIVIFAVRGFMHIGIFNKSVDYNLSPAKEDTRNNAFNNSKQMDESNGNTASWEDSADGIIMYGESTNGEIEIGANPSQTDVGIDSQYSGSEFTAFDAEANNNDIASSSEPVESITPKNIPINEEVVEMQPTNDTEVEIQPTNDAEVEIQPRNDAEVEIQLTEDVAAEENTYSVAKQQEESVEELVIGLIANSDNIELDKLKITEIANRFGTKIKDDITNNSDVDMTIGLPRAADIKAVGSNVGYFVSYSMDKSSYDQFIKEMDINFKGRYSLTNDESELNIRLKDLEDRIKELENRKSENTEEYKTLINEKEGILKKLDNINLNHTIKVDISISK